VNVSHHALAFTEKVDVVAVAVACTTRNRTHGCCTANTVPATPDDAITAGVYGIVESSVDPSNDPSIVNVVDPVELAITHSRNRFVYPVVSKKPVSTVPTPRTAALSQIS
jgi:hypothetical protein